MGVDGHMYYIILPNKGSNYLNIRPKILRPGISRIVVGFPPPVLVWPAQWPVFMMVVRKEKQPVYKEMRPDGAVKPLPNCPCREIEAVN